MVIVDIIVIASAAITLGVIAITAKFSKEMHVNQTFDELWFENSGEQRAEPSITVLDSKKVRNRPGKQFARAA
jgi:hypothetical protein